MFRSKPENASQYRGASLSRADFPLLAGSANLVIGILLGGQPPGAGQVLLTGVVGLAGYGVSLVLFVTALRDPGAARTGAYFSTAPFAGALAAVLMLGEPVVPELVLAAVLMAIGVWLHVSEDHDHWHEHEALMHDHLHVHDEHHQHSHGPEVPAFTGAHSHVHIHAPVRHKHQHYPDLHHRHGHQRT